MLPSDPHPQSDDRHDAPGARVVAGLLRIGAILRAEAWQGAGECGLTPTQGQILTLLDARGSLRPRLAEVATVLAVTPATASDAVSALVEKGLVRKRRASDDARALALELTAAGRREAKRASSWPDLLVTAAAELAPSEQDTLLRAVVKMIRRLQEEGRIEPARMCVTCRFFEPHAYPDPARPHGCALVGAAFGDRHLRVDCGDHAPGERASVDRNWAALTSVNAARNEEDLQRKKR